MDDILLIGGTGLLGPSVVHQLEESGKHVICINRSGVHVSNGTAIAADRNSCDDLKRIFRKFDSFTLIDMIPYTARQAAILVEALEGKQPNFVAVSSIDVYQAYNNLHSQGKPLNTVQKVPLFETSELRSRISFQGIEYDKLNVERIYWSYFDSCTILRMPAIFGLPDTSRVERYFNSLKNGQEIVMNSGHAAWRFSRSLNANCAHAVVLSVNTSRREVFNVAEENHHSEMEWCSLIANILGVEANIRIDASAPTPFSMNTQQHWTVSSSKIRAELGYTEKYCIESGIKAVLAQLDR